MAVKMKIKSIKSGTIEAEFDTILTEYDNLKFPVHVVPSVNPLTANLHSVTTDDLSSIRIHHVKPDRESCPTLIGERRIDHDDGTTTFSPILINCKQHSCWRCYGKRAYIKQNEFEHIYNSGNNDSWFMLTFTGRGLDSQWRCATLKEQVISSWGFFSNFITLQQSFSKDLSVPKWRNAQFKKRQALIDQTLEHQRVKQNKVDDFRSRFHLGRISRRQLDSALDDLHQAVADTSMAQHKQISLHDFATLRGKISYIAALEFKKRPRKKTDQWKCECDYHYHTHIHAHVYAPHWADAMALTRDKNQSKTCWVPRKNGGYMPTKPVRKEISRIAEISGFGRTDIRRLSHIKDDEESKEHISYIYKNYIFKTSEHASDEQYRLDVDDALNGRKIWKVGGGFSRHKNSSSYLFNEDDDILSKRAKIRRTRNSRRLITNLEELEDVVQSPFETFIELQKELDRRALKPVQSFNFSFPQNLFF
jgi:hypothetical protein